MRPRFDSDQMLSAFLGEKRSRKVVASWALSFPSIQPKQSASSRASS